MEKKKITLISGVATSNLAKEIAKKLKISLTDVLLTKHNDGEIEPSIEKSIRGSIVFIIQSTPPPAENLLELLLLIDAAKRASASYIVVVMPYFGYARADKKSKPRVPIAAKLIARLLEAAGAHRLMAIDLHADQIQGFFEIPVDHLHSSYVFIPHIKKMGYKNITIASPDTGGTNRANKYVKFLEKDGIKSDMVICYKSRKKAGEINEMKLIGEVKNKNVLLVDDIVDTAGTIIKAAELIMKAGALSVRALCPHPVLSGDAYRLIEESQLKEFIVTDTIPLKCKSKKITVLSTADLLAESIKRVWTDQSISSLFVK